MNSNIDLRTERERGGSAISDGSDTSALAPLPDAQVFPRLYDASAQREAYRMFMTQRSDLGDIVSAVNVPLITVLEWIRLGAWNKRRAKLMAVQEQSEAQLIARDRIELRRKALSDQAAAGKKLRETAEAMIDQVDNPQGLKNLGETIKAAADVEARALGVDDRGATANDEEADTGGVGKTPLVVIVQGGGLPSVKMAN